jgi:hypothetical protein
LNKLSWMSNVRNVAKGKTWQGEQLFVLQGRLSPLELVTYQLKQDSRNDLLKELSVVIDFTSYPFLFC